MTVRWWLAALLAFALFSTRPAPHAGAQPTRQTCVVGAVGATHSLEHGTNPRSIAR